jgi:hypothetical protein
VWSFKRITMATEIRYNINQVRHDNHTSPVTLTKRTFTQPINLLLVYNTSSSANASVSFDGVNLLTIKPNGSFSMDFAKLYSYWTQGDGSTTNLQVITGSEY